MKQKDGKLYSLQQAVATIKPGQLVAFGGNVLHRVPMAFVREVARQKIGNLQLIKTAGAMDIDLLCLAGLVKSVDAGFISFENYFGLAQNYRQAAQKGQIKVYEHACYTVISALRAAQAGIPFMPVQGILASELIERNPRFRVLANPFQGEKVAVVEALVPDVAVIHAQEVDEAGNVFISNPAFEDVLLAKAAKKVIVTTERIVSPSKCRLNPDAVSIPGFLVHQVVHVPGGAQPTDCGGFYDINAGEVDRYIALKTAADLDRYLEQTEQRDRQHRLNRL